MLLGITMTLTGVVSLCISAQVINMVLGSGWAALWVACNIVSTILIVRGAGG
jgi:hypothetical protein